MCIYVYMYVCVRFNLLESIIMFGCYKNNFASDFEFALQWKFLTHDFHFK